MIRLDGSQVWLLPMRQLRARDVRVQLAGRFLGKEVLQRDP